VAEEEEEVEMVEQEPAASSPEPMFVEEPEEVPPPQVESRCNQDRPVQCVEARGRTPVGRSSGYPPVKRSRRYLEVSMPSTTPSAPVSPAATGTTQTASTEPTIQPPVEEEPEMMSALEDPADPELEVVYAGKALDTGKWSVSTVALLIKFSEFSLLFQASTRGRDATGVEVGLVDPLLCDPTQLSTCPIRR